MFSSISWLAVVSTVVLFIQGAHASPAAFIVEKASLRVLSPASQVGQYDTALANFGTPLYGASLLGELVYSADNALGCTPYADLPRAKGVGHATIALVDRGSCYFAEKVLHAQLAGAQAVLVADDVDEPLLTMADPDGSAGGGTELARLAQEISIPSALVTKKVGDALRPWRATRWFSRWIGKTQYLTQTTGWSGSCGPRPTRCAAIRARGRKASFAT